MKLIMASYKSKFQTETMVIKGINIMIILFYSSLIETILKLNLTTNVE